MTLSEQLSSGLHGGISLGLSISAPSWSLWVGPLTLGVVCGCPGDLLRDGASPGDGIPLGQTQIPP